MPKDDSTKLCQFVYMLTKTRSDTWPMPVADGWAGAETNVFTISSSKLNYHALTDRRTDKALYRVVKLRLRIVLLIEPSIYYVCYSLPFTLENPGELACLLNRLWLLK